MKAIYGYVCCWEIKERDISPRDGVKEGAVVADGNLSGLEKCFQVKELETRDSRKM